MGICCTSRPCEARASAQMVPPMPFLRRHTVAGLAAQATGARIRSPIFTAHVQHGVSPCTGKVGSIGGLLAHVSQLAWARPRGWQLIRALRRGRHSPERCCVLSVHAKWQGVGGLEVCISFLCPCVAFLGECLFNQIDRRQGSSLVRHQWPLNCLDRCRR